MRKWFALLVGAAALAPFSPLDAQPKKSAHVKGVLLEMTKAEDTPTGTITVVEELTGKSTKFAVDEFTVFEIVKGSTRKKSNFLAEHKGEMVSVSPLSTDAGKAARVQILLPPPPPPPPPPFVVRPTPKPTPKGPGHVHGTVTHVVTNGPISIVTIRLHEPPAPVSGTVIDVAVNQDTGLGSVTLKFADNKTDKFTVTPATRVVKLTATDYEFGSFLSVDRGQTVVLFRQPHHTHVATKIDIMSSQAMAMYHHRHHHRHHLVSYLATADTKFSRVRDGHHTAANLAAVAVGEEVSILPTGKWSHIANHIDVILPHAVHGVMTGLGGGAVKVKIHHNKQDTEVVIPLAPGTAVETVDAKKARKNVPLAALHTGERVVVFPAGPPPHVAEKVEIHLPAIHAINVRGRVVSMAAGAVTVSVHHPAKDGKPAHDVPHTFQLGPTAKLELHKGKNVEPGNAAMLANANDVSVHGKSGSSPPIAERLEIHTKVIKMTGQVAGLQGGVLTLRVKDAMHKFALTGNTQLHLVKGKDRTPATLAHLQSAKEVTVHGWSGIVAAADKIDIKAPPAGKKPPTGKKPPKK